MLISKIDRGVLLEGVKPNPSERSSMKKVFVALIALVAIAVAMPPPASASVVTNTVDSHVAMFAGSAAYANYCASEIAINNNENMALQPVADQHQIATIFADVPVADTFQFAIQMRDMIADNRHPVLVSSEVLITDSWAKRNGQANFSTANGVKVLRV